MLLVILVGKCCGEERETGEEEAHGEDHRPANRGECHSYVEGRG